MNKNSPTQESLRRDMSVPRHLRPLTDKPFGTEKDYDLIRRAEDRRALGRGISHFSDVIPPDDVASIEALEANLLAYYDHIPALRRAGELATVTALHVDVKVRPSKEESVAVKVA